MTTVLVFGATGFLGRNVVEKLLAAGHEVHAISSQGREVPGAARCLPMSRLAGAPLENLPLLPPDAVAIHLAAAPYDASAFAQAQSDILTRNVEITDRIYAFCALRGIKEVRLASSAAVYPASWQSLDDARPLDLNDAPHAGEAMYAWSKRWAEIAAGLYAQKYGIATISFRISNPYGPYDSTDPARAHVAAAFLMRALEPGPEFAIRGDPEVERDFIYAGDVAEAFLRSLARRGETGAYNLATGTSTSLRRFAEIAIAASGNAKTVTAPGGSAGPGGPQSRRTTSDHIRAALGLEFTPLAEGVSRALEWYRAQPSTEA